MLVVRRVVPHADREFFEVEHAARVRVENSENALRELGHVLPEVPVELLDGHLARVVGVDLDEGFEDFERVVKREAEHRQRLLVLGPRDGLEVLVGLHASKVPARRPAPPMVAPLRPGRRPPRAPNPARSGRSLAPFVEQLMGVCR